MMSQQSRNALITLGTLIHAARQDHAYSQAALAERLNVTRQTIIAIEKGNPTVAIGTVFEAAHLLGIPLFSENNQQLSKWQAILSGFSALLPTRIHKKKYEVNDEF